MESGWDVRNIAGGFGRGQVTLPSPYEPPHASRGTQSVHSCRKSQYSGSLQANVITKGNANPLLTERHILSSLGEVVLRCIVCIMTSSCCATR